MFVHDSKLRHLLTPDHYRNPEHHQRELENLFLPAWHIVGTTGDVPRDGSFFTTDLLEQPILVRRFGDEVRSFLNVCAHRHSRLTHQNRGCSKRFACQYHGWEYDCDGRTGKIPDARAFRPWDRENAHLRRFATEVLGELIWVRLTEQGPSLQEFLGPYYDYTRESFGGTWQKTWTWETGYQANWKVPVENSLESYHIPCLHKVTFGNFPEEDNCEHDLANTYTQFRTAEPRKIGNHIQAWFVRQLRRPLTRVYTHHHCHPHITYASLDVMRLIMMFLPTSATTSLHRVWLYAPKGPWSPWRGSVALFLRYLVKLIARQVLVEDAGIFTDVQRGLDVSPFPGVIGNREERIYYFQEYVLQRCSPQTNGRTTLDLISDHHATQSQGVGGSR
jgi:choline monooxygenase